LPKKFCVFHQQNLLSFEAIEKHSSEKQVKHLPFAGTHKNILLMSDAKKIYAKKVTYERSSVLLSSYYVFFYLLKNFSCLSPHLTLINAERQAEKL